MKKYFIFILITLYVLPAYSISDYSAKYDFFADTDFGNIKFGSAEYELEVTNNLYVFKSTAKTDQLWSAIYNYSVSETSFGLIEDDELIGDYYKIIENKGDSISDNYEINLYPKKGFASLNNEVLNNGFIISELEKLSDSELILKAIDSGNFDKIKFAGNQAKDNETPSYKKDLANKEDLIEALSDLSLDNNTPIVDVLSLYLNISEDIQKSPNKKVFTYQVVDKTGIAQR